MIQNSDIQQTDVQQADSDQTRPRAKGLRSRRVRAILAGGLVLGVGAAITLAAWNDSEFAQGTFTAGAFNMVGSLDGTSYTEHATTGAAATLAFTVPTLKLSPTDSVYAPFAVELDSTSTNNAVVTISNAISSGSGANLTYSVIQPTTFGCTSATTGTTLIASSALGAATGASTFALTKGAGVAGAPAFLCIKVTAGAGLVQSQTGTSTWQFTAVSQ